MTRKPISALTDEEETRIQAGIDSDPDNPELTDQQLAMAKPFAELFPALSEAIKRLPGRPKVAAPKQAVTLRLSPDTIERYKALGGAGWRAQMSAMLEKSKPKLHRPD